MERDFKALALELREFIGASTEATAVVVTPRDEPKGIDILPASSNTMGVFYHIEELANFVKYHKLNCWIDSHVHDGDNVARVHIY